MLIQMKNLVDLMHGQIALESRPDTGTIATFSIPFNKPQFMGTSIPIVDLRAVPERLQSELSLSCDNSSQGGNFATSTSTPFHSPKHKAVPSIDVGKGSAASPSKTAPEGMRGESNAHHILVVEDNAINQQIALRTIKKMNYTVSAVWNGQEALDYLLEATHSTQKSAAASSPDHYILPSLILMDVQMPVLDGYGATHTLRHHAPYKSLAVLQNIPVVAMTASAIQGDREKCQRAGMNDYLAKPVKRVTLEKMIHKWVNRENQHVRRSTSMEPTDIDSARPDLSRNATTRTMTADHSSNCPGADYQIAEAKSDDLSLGSRRMSTAQSPLLSVGMSQVKNASDRGLRLTTAAEMAASSRNAKLIDAATENDELGAPSLNGSLGKAGQSTSVGSHVHEAYPDQHGEGLALTEENVEKLNADSADDRAAMPQVTPVAAGPPEEQLSDASEAIIESLDAIPVPIIAVSGGSTIPVIDSLTEPSATKSRRGQLSTSDRKRSDWSSASTLKPSQE